MTRLQLLLLNWHLLRPYWQVQLSDIFFSPHAALLAAR